MNFIEKSISNDMVHLRNEFVQKCTRNGKKRGGMRSVFSFRAGCVDRRSVNYVYSNVFE